MGGRSSSKSSSTSNTDNRQLAVSDGLGVLGDGDVSIETTDFGAIDAGRRVSEKALDTADRSIDRTAQTALASLDKGFDFGTRIQSSANDAARQANETVRNAFQGVQELAKNVVRGPDGESNDTARIALLVGGGLGAVFGLYLLVRSTK